MCIGLEAAAEVAARGELANALGEGFADGLDVGRVLTDERKRHRFSRTISKPPPRRFGDLFRRHVEPPPRGDACASPTGWKSATDGSALGGWAYADIRRADSPSGMLRLGAV